MERRRIPALDCAGRVLLLVDVHELVGQVVESLDVRLLAYRGEDGNTIEYDLERQEDIQLQFTAYEPCYVYPAIEREVAPGEFFRVIGTSAYEHLNKGQRTAWEVGWRCVMVMGS